MPFIRSNVRRRSFCLRGRKMKVVRWFFPLTLIVIASLPTSAQTPVGNPSTYSLKSQPYQRPESCLPCHQRQFDELQLSVKSGYRTVSPLFNSLEMGANFLNGGRLRPVYSDSTKTTTSGTPLRSNLFSTPAFTHVNQVAAGFCLTCHNAHVVSMGENPLTREVPEVPGVGNDFQPDQFRPLRDYALVDAGGH